MRIVPKYLIPFLLVAAFALIVAGYYFLDKSTVSKPEHTQFTSEIRSDEPLSDSSHFGLFSSAQICKAITIAVLGTESTEIELTRLENKNVVSFKRDADAAKSSYECEKIGDRFYWESTSKLVSSSVIEVEPRVSDSRTDELTLYIFDTSDTGNIVKTFNIEQL